MPVTYTPIATNTLSSSGTVTFSSIPQTYTDLVLVCNLQSASGAPTPDVRVALQFNGDTATNYSTTNLIGTGTSALSAREVNRAQVDNVAHVSTFGSGEFALFTYQINNYSNTTTYKSVLQRAGNNTNSDSTYREVGSGVSLWRNTAAITSILVKGFAQNGTVGFVAGSTFTLYGIKSA